MRTLNYCSLLPSYDFFFSLLFREVTSFHIRNLSYLHLIPTDSARPSFVTSYPHRLCSLLELDLYQDSYQLLSIVLSKFKQFVFRVLRATNTVDKVAEFDVQNSHQCNSEGLHADVNTATKSNQIKPSILYNRNCWMLLLVLPTLPLHL